MKTYRLIFAFLIAIFWMQPALANLLVPIEQTPKKTIFIVREDVDFASTRNFTLLNNFSSHTKFESTQELYPSADSVLESPERFSYYQDEMGQALWETHLECLTTVTQFWAEKLGTQPDEIFYEVSMRDWATLVIGEIKTHRTIVTPNICDVPEFSYSALVLKSSTEGDNHQLSEGEKLEVSGIRVNRFQHAYRISISFRGHDFVKSLDIITSTMPKDIQIQQLNFSTFDDSPNHPTGNTFQIQIPKQKYF